MPNKIELKRQRQGLYSREREKLLQIRDGYRDMTGEDLFFILRTMYQHKAQRLGTVGSKNPPDEFVFPGRNGEVRVSRYERYSRQPDGRVAYNVSFVKADGVECEIGTVRYGEETDYPETAGIGYLVPTDYNPRQFHYAGTLKTAAFRKKEDASQVQRDLSIELLTAFNSLDKSSQGQGPRRRW